MAVWLYQNVEAGGFQERDLIGDGQPREARHSFGELHNLDNALSGQLTELVPQAQVQPHTVVCTRVLHKQHNKKKVYVNHLENKLTKPIFPL